MTYILSLDQGTTSSRAILFTHDGKIHSQAQQEFKQIYPRPGWVEHDPFDILTSQLATAVEVLGKGQVRPRDIMAAGVTNQRETTIVWDRETGKPVYNAIVWQDRRTAEACDQLRQAGATDTVIMRFCELIMSIPALYLIISLRNAFPPDMSSSKIYAMIVIILSFIGWASMARVIRGMTLSLREQQFVLAARALGQSHLKVICRHILPNTFSYVIVAATLSVPYYILGEVVLSFLGVGIQEPQASWGNMLTAAENTEYLRSFPWLLAPSAAIFITVLAFNFLGDGLRDAADTKSL